MAWLFPGTHWTWEVTSMLMQDGKEQNLSKEVAMLPFVTPEKIDELPSPRLMNSHCYFKHLPQEILKKKNKIIFVNRNPKDVAVSFYHHCQHVANYKGTFSQFLDFFMSERGELGFLLFHLLLSCPIETCRSMTLV